MPRAVKRKHADVVTAKSLAEFKKDDMNTMNAEVDRLAPNRILSHETYACRAQCGVLHVHGNLCAHVRAADTRMKFGALGNAVRRGRYTLQDCR
jgi:hypothetical protein